MSLRWIGGDAAVRIPTRMWARQAKDCLRLYFRFGLPMLSLRAAGPSRLRFLPDKIPIDGSLRRCAAVRSVRPGNSNVTWVFHHHYQEYLYHVV